MRRLILRRLTAVIHCSRTNSTDRVTRVEDTIVLCHLGVPRLNADDWSLSIDGRVRRPRRLMLDELMRRPRVELTSIHQCCGSPLKPDMPTRRICNMSCGLGAQLPRGAPAV